jgi:uncharacterized protein (UPF0248 family)
VNKNVYLRNIKSRLQNSTLNNWSSTIERIKNNLPTNVKKNDVNNMVRKMKSQVLQKIFNKLRNTPLNNFNTTVERIKTNLPTNISRTDVNNIVRSMKPQVLQKIFNKLKNSPPNNRVRIMNTMKNRGFMNNSDIVVIKKKLLGPNFVRNSKKPPSTTRTVNKMNSNNVRKSPYI